MPIPRRQAIGRRQQWTTRHFAHLLTGTDWGTFLGDEGWGHQNAIAESDIAATVEDMLACWLAHGDNLHELCEGVYYPDAPWFAEYAHDPNRLIAEITADCAYMAEQRRRGGYFPRSEMNDYTSAASAPAAEN